jgi:hypothetical protein
MHNIPTEKTTMTSKVLMFGLTVALLVPIVNITIAINPIKAERGKVAIATANNGEASRMKFLEAEAFEPVSSNLTSSVLTPKPNSNAGIIEYVAILQQIEARGS